MNFLNFLTGRQMALSPAELKEIREVQRLAMEYDLSGVRRAGKISGEVARPKSQSRKGGNAEEKLQSTRRASNPPLSLVPDPAVVDLQSALVNLGMARPEALEVAKRVKSGHPTASFDDLLREALKLAA